MADTSPSGSSSSLTRAATACVGVTMTAASRAARIPIRRWKATPCAVRVSG